MEGRPKIDYRVFPGLRDSEKLPDRIIGEAKEYLNVPHWNSRNSTTIACKRLAAFLIMKHCKKLSLSKIGGMIWTDHSSLIHHRDAALDLYKGESRFYHFTYLNLDAKLQWKKYFTVQEFVDKARESLNLKERKSNTVLTMFLLRNQVSKREIQLFLGLDGAININKIKAEKEHLKTVEDLIDQMNETTTNHLYEKRNTNQGG